jgi:transcriptional regulator with XRE-family HTH domain
LPSREPNLTAIKTRLRQCRLSAGLSSSELAERVGKSPATIRRLENPANDSLCDFVLFASLCSELGVPADYVLHGERREANLISDAEFKSRSRKMENALTRRQKVALMNMVAALQDNGDS